ncbi:MAG: type III-B CRISPR module-associated Cmr3 family protein [Sulfolobales archaeon]
MEIALARVKFLEPLMLRGAGEFDPSSRGVYSYASSLYLPRPSTIVGSLITHLYPQSQVSTFQSFEDLLDFYGKALDYLGIKAIRGFHVYNGKNDKYCVPLVMDRKGSVLVDYDLVRSLNVNLLESLVGCTSSSQCSEGIVEELKLFKEGLRWSVLEPKVQERVGIALRTRLDVESSKMVREGYIYTAKYVSYVDPVLEIRFNIVLNNSNVGGYPTLLGRDLAVKLGGEQRIAKIRVEGRDKITEKLKELTTKEHEYYLLTTPAPINPGDEKRLHGYIGRRDLIGLGYSLALKKRKPLYPVLLEGTIVKVRKIKPDEGTLHYGIYAILGLHEHHEYRTLGRIGYGTVIPVA